MENSNVPAQQLNNKVAAYTSAGEEVKLSMNIVRNYLVRGDQSKVTDQDVVLFINICQFNKLNPFLNEAYLVKYGSAPAQMIVSKEAYLKRADACPNYEGIQAGVILVDSNGVLSEPEGCFVPKGYTLVGGWAKVYRSDRKFPIVAKANLEEFDKKQSTWNAMKATMIAKIAKVQALREAFPSQLGAMYVQEEAVTIDTTAEFVDLEPKRIALTGSGEVQNQPAQDPGKTPEPTPQPTPPVQPVAQAPKPSIFD